VAAYRVAATILLPPWIPHAVHLCVSSLPFLFQIVEEIEIKEFLIDVDGELKKTTTGISLSLEEWEKVNSMIRETMLKNIITNK
jgi:hypothetical protein